MTHAEKELRNQKIVELRKQGYSQTQIADMFGLSGIHAICKRYGVDGKLSDRKADYKNINYRNGWTKELQEEYARDTVDRMLFGFSYVGNYTGSGGTADIRCNVCGEVFTQPFISIRKGNNIICPYCKKHEEDERSKKHKTAQEERRTKQREQKERKAVERLAKKRIVQCEICGKTFITFNQTQVCCSAECSKKRSNAIASHRKDTRITTDKRIDKNITARKLYERDNGICWICNKPCDLDDYVVRNGVVVCGNNYPSVDHVIPVCDGGNDSWDNVRLAHRYCNSRRFWESA